MKKIWNRVIAVMLVLCLMLSMTAVAADSSVAQNSVGGMQNTAAVSEENTGKVMMLKLNETQAYLNGSMIPTLAYGSGYVSKLIMVNGSTLLPLRFVCECLGFEVGYNEQTNNSTITDTANGVKFELVTGTTEMYKYDLEGNLLASGTATAPTTIIEGVTHVPVRSLLEAMGFYVYWDDKGYVLISEDPMTSDDFEGLIKFWDENIDSDYDGVPDIIERIFGMDPLNPDTDGDELPDGYEIRSLKTNPLAQDTDGNNVPDGAEDIDGDGLTNLQEFNLGTDPLKEDSDDDGLTDYDEVNTYNTDPWNPDCDADFINDGDEIAMGLNPLNSQTFDVHDSQYIFTQTISSAKLEEINADNLYEMQIDIQSAGHANTSLSVNESLSCTNSAILGKPVELDYDGNLKFEEMTITFALDIDAVGEATGFYNNPELEGIHRFQIFYFDETTSSLCPIETSYDTVNNTLTATVTKTGAYMMIDLDLWMYTLGVVPEGGGTDLETPEQDQAAFGSEVLSVMGAVQAVSEDELCARFDSVVSQQIENAMKKDSRSFVNSSAIDPSQYNRQIDLVFAINVRQSTGIFPSIGGIWTDTSSKYYDTRTMLQGTALEHLKLSVVRTVKRLHAEKGITANVCIVSFGGTSDCVVHKLNGSEWVNTSSQIIQILSEIGNAPEGGRHLDTLETIMELPFRENVPKFVVLITNNEIVAGNNNCGKTLEDVANKLKAMEIMPLISTPTSHLSSYQTFCNITGAYGWNALAFDIKGEQDGIEYPGFVELIYQHTWDQEPECTYISAHDLSELKLYEPLTKNGTMDTDGDGLTDWEEVDQDALEWLAGVPYNDGDIITRLPTYREYLAYHNINLAGLDSKSRSMLNVRVLPVKSNPGKKDSDGDGMHDGARHMVGNNGQLIKVVPKDPHPFKYDGPVGAKAVWDEQFRMQCTGDNIATGYADVLENTDAFLKQYYEAVFPHFEITDFTLTALANIGSLALMFRYDNKQLALHSDPVYQWQQIGGYNDFYDFVFNIATSMDRTKLNFTLEDGQSHAVWAWKGNYMNVGPGAEIGFYTKDNNLTDLGIELWWVTDVFPITLSLYRKTDSGYSNYCNWQPADEQWRITTSAPPWDSDITKDQLLMVGSVDFSGSEREKTMYSALKESDSAREYSKRLIFDDEGDTLWIMW